MEERQTNLFKFWTGALVALTKIVRIENFLKIPNLGLQNSKKKIVIDLKLSLEVYVNQI